MDEVEYVVPPANTVSGGSKGSKSPIKPPKEPSKALEWLKSHKLLSIASVAMVGLVGLVAFVMITGQQVSLFGYQLNPMYQQANCPSPLEFEDGIGVCGGGTPNIPSTPAPSPTQSADAPIVQISIADSNSSSPNLPGACDTTSDVSGPAGSVSTNGDADCLKVTIANPRESYDKDFRVCFTLDSSMARCTPWASEGGGASGQIQSGGSFQSASIATETRDLPTGKKISAVQVGVQVYYQQNNDACGASSGMQWARAIAGQNVSNPWSYGAQNDDDPGCAQIALQAQLVDVQTPQNSQITISGTFAGGIVGAPYAQGFTVSGSANQPCTWSLMSISPTISGANISSLDVSGLAATFNATPVAAGTYQVTIKVVCQGGQETTTTLPWVVSAATSTPSSGLTISGVFATGQVNTPYTQQFSVVGNTSGAACEWDLVSITPSMPSATFQDLGSINKNSGIFRATPTQSGTYQVSMRATCSTNVASATLPWVVTGIRSTPETGSSGLMITGSFPAGTVGTAYETTVKTSNLPATSCNWTLVSVTPAVAGATVTRIDNIMADGIVSATYRATPTVAGIYKVTISAACDSGNAQSSFEWVVGKTTVAAGGSANSCLDQSALAKLSAIYRYWSPAMGDHLYTTNPNEKPSGYRFEGVAGYVFATQMTNTVPIYRSAQKQIGSHYYTTTNEDPTQYGYVDEGILGYAYANAVTGSSPWYRMHKGGAESDYVHTISEEERSAIKELGYVDQGIVAHICGGSKPTELQPLFRLWGAADRDHFYTTNFSERDSLLTRNYVSEGITGYIYGVRKDGSVPLHRAYSRAIGDHLYTLSEAEARSAGYVYEGIMGYISPVDTQKTTPLYRLYSPAMGDHFYTASASEAAAAIASGYKGEGITGYLYLSQ